MPAEQQGSTARPGDALAQAIELSRRMLDAARVADWDALARLEALRAPLLDRALAAGGRAGEASQPEAAARLAACLRLNDEVAALTAAHVARLASLLADGAGPAADRGPPGDR